MRTVLVTGSDTGVGKTRVVAALARLLAAGGARVQIVKVVETGRPAAGDRSVETGVAWEGDAACAKRLSGTAAEALTLQSFAAPLAPAAAAAAEGRTVSFDALAGRVRALAASGFAWRIIEGAGGIATPIEAGGRDWADFALAVGADVTVVVVADRLGAINQARLALGRATQRGLNAGLWLNAVAPVDVAVAASNRDGLRSAGVPLWGEQGFDSVEPADPAAARERLAGTAGRAEERAGDETSDDGTRAGSVAVAGGATLDGEGVPLFQRMDRILAERASLGLKRALRVTEPAAGTLNLADNDYLELAHDPAVTGAAAAAAALHGTSASASPLITGWQAPHARLAERLCAWHGFPFGMLWSSGYAANGAVLGGLPGRGDVVLADRLIHHSMIAGLLRSGARLRRYEHLRLDRLEEMLVAERTAGPAAGRTVYVATESVFSMDGDYPDLRQLAALKRQHGFVWIVDEAHALGWYGPEGSGLVREAGVEADVDVLVGTLGKTLASGGAYTLFRREAVRDFLVNTAGEFIYSTALPPANAAAARAALERVAALAPEQAGWRAASRAFRARLQTEGWAAPEGDSPIVPVRLDDAGAAVALGQALRTAGILAGVVRPPTVPAGTSRLRFSLKRSFDGCSADRVLGALAAWRAAR